VNFHTLAARGGRDVPSASRPLTAPIYQTNVYVFEDMDTVESVWESKKPGFVYGRYGTGNHAMLEDLVAALEGAEAAVACASGMGATTALLLGLFAPGDHLVSARDLYGSTAAFLGDEGRRLGVETDFVDATDTAAILDALRPATRAVFVEAVSNPLLRLVDVPSLAPELTRRGIDLIVDASMTSPAVFRPIEHGASMVMHSLTKFISGHGDVTGGLVAGRAEPMARVRNAMIRAGTNLGPFDAWLATRGARTLAVRMPDGNIVRIAFDVLLRHVEHRAKGQPVGDLERRAHRLLETPPGDVQRFRVERKFQQRIVVRGAPHEKGRARIDHVARLRIERHVHGHGPEPAIGPFAGAPGRKERQARHALLAGDAVREQIDPCPFAEIDAREPPSFEGALIGILTLLGGRGARLEKRAVVVEEWIMIGRVVRAHTDQRMNRSRGERLIRPSFARAPRAAVIADAACIRAGPSRLEEDGAAGGEPVGLDGGIAAVDLDAIDEPERHHREIRGARDIVIQARACEIHGRARGCRAAHGGRRRRTEPARLTDDDAGLRAQDILRLEPRSRETIARNHGARDPAVFRRNRITHRIAHHADLGLKVGRGKAADLGLKVGRGKAADLRLNVRLVSAGRDRDGRDRCSEPERRSCRPCGGPKVHSRHPGGRAPARHRKRRSE